MAPYVSLTRFISPVTMSSASSQLMRTYLLTPRFWMLRPPGAGGAGSAARVEVHPLHGVADAGRREDPLLVGEAERRGQRLVARVEGLAPGVHDPGLDFFLGVLVVEAGGADADDLAVLRRRPCRRCRPNGTPMKHMSRTMTRSPDSFTGPLNSNDSPTTLSSRRVAVSTQTLRHHSTRHAGRRSSPRCAPADRAGIDTAVSLPIPLQTPCTPYC